MKKQILSILLVLLMLLGLLSVNAFAADGLGRVCVPAEETAEVSPFFSTEIAVPVNGNSAWGYVSKLVLSGTGGSVYEAYWSSSVNPFVLDVILDKNTPKDATITATFSVAGMRAPSISGETAVTLADGKGKINVTAVKGVSFYSDTHWTINLTVDDGSAANRSSYAVTLPTETVGYTVAAYNSESPVVEGHSFHFTVTIDDNYKTDETFAVKANGTVLTATNGIYTIENITEDKIVTVDGVVEKTLAEKNVTILAPAGSTVSSGRFHTYFKYDFNKPLETATVEDGRVRFIFPVPASQGFLRVQHPDGVTYWDFDNLTAGSIFEITEEMLFIGSTEFTKETVYAGFEKNVLDKADLYLTANEKGWLDLNTGDTRSLNVFRNFLSLGNSISNSHVALPDTEYKVISVDGSPSDIVSVTPDANNSCYAEIKAEKPGTAIILVSYDAVYNNDGQGSKQWSAVWPENTGVIVVTVDAEDASIVANMTVNEEVGSGGKQAIDAEHDILFYVDDSGASYSFKPEEGCTVTVNRSFVGSTMTFNGFSSNGVKVADDGTVTVNNLTTGAHIIKVEKNGRAVYQVVRARQVSYELQHSNGSTVSEECPAQPGETITVQFSGLISPMEKLSGVYNANFGFYYNGPDDAQIRTSGGSYGVYTFSGTPGLQKFSVTIPSGWNEPTYTLTDGTIKIGGYGSNAGAHRTTSYSEGKEISTNAKEVSGVLSVLPDIVINTIPYTHIPVEDSNLKINHSLNLASDISVNFLVDKSLLSGFDMDTVYAESTVDTYTENEKTGTATARIYPVENGNYYYFTLTDLTAVNMVDNISTVIYGTKDGQLYCSPVDEYSIATYAYSQLNKAAVTGALKTLCADLLRYGAKAQVFKSYRTDAFADSTMTDAHKDYLSNIEAVTFGNTNRMLDDLENAPITWAGKTLNLESRVSLKFVFDPKNYTGDVSALTLRVSYADINGNEKTVELEDPSLYNEARGYYAFTLDTLLAAELRSVISVQVYSGETPVSSTRQYSADTYGNNKTGVLLDLCKALFAYSDSAKAYFAE